MGKDERKRPGRPTKGENKAAAMRKFGEAGISGKGQERKGVEAHSPQGDTQVG